MGCDHSYECDVCGEMRGGLDDLYCDCDYKPSGPRETLFIIQHHLTTLAHNFATGAALQRAFMLGFWLGHEAPFLSGDEVPEEWQPGRGKAAP